ncbi:MAG: hypothetical protein NTU95_11940 [Methanothrix sp.]|nr:hypothetical protein [Methanothrix sp.]
MALEPQGTQEPGNGSANTDIKEAASGTGQNQTANDSLFLEDFNRVNDPYKETLFATGQGRRNESINYYANLTVALTAFQEKYKDFRPAVIKADEQFSGDMMNASAIISDVKDGVYTGNLTEAHKKLEEVRPIFQKILNRNGLLPLSVALVDFHDVMELVLDAANNKDASKVEEVYPKADEKLRAVEAISSDPGIISIRANLDEVLSLAKENKTAELPAKAGDLKASYVKVYLATS